MSPFRMNAAEHVSRTRPSSNMPCPLCFACHGPPGGDLGGTAYDDERDKRLMERLFKFHRARAGAYAVRLLPLGARGRALPRDIQMFAAAARARYPQGVLLIHDELRACFLFRCGQMPQLVNLRCGAHSLCPGSGEGFALLRGDRMLRLSVSKKYYAQHVSARAMAFTLSRAARPANGAAEQPAPKVPKLRELTIEAGPGPPIPKRLPPTADVEVAIYKVTDDASAVWDDVKDPIALYQVQIRHDATKSCTVNLYDKFNTYLSGFEEGPHNIVELQRQALIKLVTTDGKDPDDVGFHRWRNAFYVSGNQTSLLNFLLLLDEFWFQASEDVGKDVVVSLHPHEGINIGECWDLVLYETYTLHEPARVLPMGIFECQPVQGKRILMMTLQVESDDKITFVFHGATWPFRGRFDAAGVPGYSYEEESLPKYVRVLESLNTATQDGRARVIHLLGEGVLRNTAMRVAIEGELKPGTHAFRFVQTLRKRTHLHFV